MEIPWPKLDFIQQSHLNWLEQAFTKSIKNLPEWAILLLCGVFVIFMVILAIQIYFYLQNRRLIQDTPTSKIRSASQGQVELIGKAKPIPSLEQTAPLTLKPCIWFTYSLEREIKRHNGELAWEMVHQGCSDDLFLLTDETGSCVVAPLGANINTSHLLRWETNNLPQHLQTAPTQEPTRYRLFEARIEVDDPLYVLGYFETTRVLSNKIVDSSVQDPKTRKSSLPVFGNIADTLAQWQNINDHNLLELKEEQPLHVIHQHKQLRLPFMISNYSEKKLANYYLFKTFGHTALLAISLWLVLHILEITYLR